MATGTGGAGVVGRPPQPGEVRSIDGLWLLWRSFGSEITGYRSPSWDFSPHTLGGPTGTTGHPQIIGRPGRLAFLDAFIAFVTGHEDVWVTTTAEIAGRV